MSADPRATVRRWAPHLAAWSLALLAAWGLWQVLAPVHLPILTGGALALLAHPVLCEPLDRLLRRLVPRMRGGTRRSLAAGAATIALAAAAAGLATLLLWAALGGLDLTGEALWGLATGDPAGTRLAVDRLALAAADLHRLYPALPLDDARLRPVLEDLLSRTRVGPEFLRFLVTGTGGALVELVLAGATMFYLLDQGPRLAHRVLALLPLDLHRRAEVRRRFRAAGRSLVLGTGGRALAQGITIGLAAWAIADFHPVLVGAVAVLVGLLPLIGAAFIWLPLASLLATQGRWLEAVCLAIACQTTAWLLDHAGNRVARALGNDRVWMGWLLFLAVVGGILGSGIPGLVLGPAAVIVAVAAGDLAAGLYRRLP